MELFKYHLTEDGINSIIDKIKAFFISRKISDRDILKTTLLIEEALLRCRDRFGRDQEVSFRTSGIASAKVTINMISDAFDPLDEHKNEDILSSEYIRNLLVSEVTTTTYNYRNGCNEIIVIARKEWKDLKIPGGAVSIAVLLAIAASLIAKLLPDAAVSFFLNDLVTPLFNRVMGIITLVTGPLIFISIVSSICALNDIETLSSIGLKAIRRFALITVLLITFSVIISLLLFPGISSSSNNAFNLSAIIEMFIDLIPQDLVSPFVENQTIQIIIIAVAIGVALLLLDEKIPILRKLVSETNQLIFTLMGFVSKIIPLAVFLSIYKAITLNSLSSIFGVWKLVLSGYVIMVPFTAGMVLYVCLRRKINILQFLKNISEPAIVGFTSASGTLAMTKQFETARYKMNKDEKLVNFWVPLSHAMFSPSVIPPLVAAAFFSGTYYGTPVSLPQILIMYILVTQLSIASPKVPGGIMATFTIMLSQLGMPTDVVGLLMIANVFVVNAETGLAMIIRSAELEEFSHIIDTKKMR